MRVLGHFHLYPPGHNAGAEWMAHSILTRFLPAAEVRVLTTFPPRRRDSFEGVSVEYVPRQGAVMAEYQRASIAVTHLDASGAAMRQARRTRTPLVHLVHNHRQLAHNGVRPDVAQLVVWNSEWLADPEWQGESMVVVPPVWLDRFESVTPGDCVTLVNLTEAKGAPVFFHLAELFPDVPFLGVRGAYGVQAIPDVLPPNVTIIPNQRDIRVVYDRTRVLLMPSTYESFGRVGVEAAACGIPTIASDTPGLLEAGVACANLPIGEGAALPPVGGFPREAPSMDAAVLAPWAEQLSQLLTDPAEYAAAAAHGRARAAELESVSERQVSALVARMTELAG